MSARLLGLVCQRPPRREQATDPLVSWWVMVFAVHKPCAKCQHDHETVMPVSIRLADAGPGTVASSESYYTAVRTPCCRCGRFVEVIDTDVPRPEFSQAVVLLVARARGEQPPAPPPIAISPLMPGLN